VSLPDPVRAHRARPLPWLLAAVALAGVLVGVGYRGAHDDRVWARAALRVDGQVVEGPRGAQLEVTYTHPVTDQEVQVSVDTWGKGDDLRPGDPVALLVDPDSPEHLAIVGDHQPPVDPTSLVLLLSVPVVACAVRWWSVQRTVRLVTAPATSFALLGAVAPSGRVRRRPLLHLYALDAAPGDPSLCAVRLLTTAGAPLAGPAFPVQVKGVPRPMGRVAARIGDGDAVLWPAARAIMHGSRPRPDRVVDATPPPAADPGDLPAWVAAGGRYRQRTSLLLGLGPSLGVLAAAVVFGAVVTAVTLAGAAAARHGREGREPAVAEVVARDAGAYRVDLRYRVGSRTITAPARVAVADDYTVGRRYPVLIAADDPDDVVLSREGYDRGSPLVWGWIPTVVAALVAGRAVATWRRSARVARRGPWSRLDLWPAPGDVLLLGDQAGGYVRGAIAGRPAVPALRALWTAGGPLARAPGWALTPPGDPVTVAGRPEPGGAVALIDGHGDVYLVAHRLRVPGPAPIPPALGAALSGGEAGLRR
jgi:hypothetical protein